MKIPWKAARSTSLVAVTVVAASAIGATALAASPGQRPASSPQKSYPAYVQILTPRAHDDAGMAGAAWVVDLKVGYPGGARGPDRSGFTTAQLTGPVAHANTAPFPGTFSTGPDDRLPGLVVLSSTTNSTITGFSGPGTNLANLFNITAVSNRTRTRTQIHDTWIVGAAIAGKNVNTVLRVAVVSDRNHDGVYNDAPAVVPDSNHNGRIDDTDLHSLGLASAIKTVRFHLSG